MKRISIFIALTAFILNANAQDFKPDGYINGYPYVEMCGLKWACYNVGATKPTEYGNYYAWGETQPAPDTNHRYTESNCRLYKKNVGDIGGDSRYDAARANWGSTWRLPTWDEQQRLLNQCKWEVKTINGTAGMLVTDSSTSKSIFLPFAGHRDGSDLEGDWAYSEFWSSSSISNPPYGAYVIYVGLRGRYELSIDYRC